MAIRRTIMDQIDPKRKKDGFFNGLKNWAISPGGITTIVLVIATIWYVNHKTSKAK
jgi:hypothetical protein